MMAELPKATIIRIFKDAGAARVSGDVADAVNKVVAALAKEAVKACKEAGRKTVTADDIKCVAVR
jgi:histone H3/H4